MRTISVLLFLLILGCTPKDQQSAKEIIGTQMQSQEMAWNNGDLEAFMAPYLQSDSLVFIGSKGLSYGWQKVLDNYKIAYPNKEKMGTLKFINKQMRPLGKMHYWVAGSWQLYRTTDTLSGHYTLVWALQNGKWVIISDHSS
jgi:hypothetical protein